MTLTRDPFPTVKKLAEECGSEWSHFREAAEVTARTEEVFRQAIQDEGSKAGVPQGRLLDTDSSLVLFGSFARHEMVPGSDCDWTLLINGVVNNRHAHDARLIERAIRNAAENGKALKKPGPTGTFGNLCFSHDLVHKIGGVDDSNENLTRRILMLLESRPVSLSQTDSASEVWTAVLRSILERYFEEDVHFSQTKKVPRFLLNDLTRYWRTICVDYAAKHREQEGAKWAIRNAKIRLSRKLLYATGLAFCFRCQLNPPAPEPGMSVASIESFIAAALEFAGTAPLEFLAKFIDDSLNGDKRISVSEHIFGSYNGWLGLLGDPERRVRLESLGHSEANGDESFQEVRKLGSDFADGLKLLFFDRTLDTDPIANLSLEYVGF